MTERTHALVTLSNASFGYGARVVVSDVSLRVERGDFIGIIGPNGAGKTTLFRGLLGLIPPSRGSVERDGSTIGYVPQRDTLDTSYPLRVDEVVHMGAYGRLGAWRRLSADERASAHACLERVDLAEHARERFGSLSGGQRQRVLIARALMTRPSLLLLDEPTSGVDSRAREQIRELLATLSRDDALTVLMISHQASLLRALATRAIWVADGRIEVSPPERILAGERLEELFGAGDGTT